MSEIKNTPKEDAIAMCIGYAELMGESNITEWSKKCALFAVNDFILPLVTAHSNDLITEFNDDGGLIEQWEQIKQELENL